MYNKTPAAYRHNPLMDSTSKQISFLFGRIVHFIEEGERFRNEKNYQEFATQNQRAISVIHGLSSFLESEAIPGVSNAWDKYFLMLIRGLNLHIIEPNPMLFKRLCDNVRHMEQLLKEADAHHHIIVNPSNTLEHEANDNLSAPTNKNDALHMPHQADTTTHVRTDLNISI